MVFLGSFVSASSGVDLISVLIPLVVVRWLPTAVEQGVQLRADGLRCEFPRLSLAGVESASPEASGRMGRMNIRLKLTLGEAEERGNGNWEILDYIQYSGSSHYNRYCGTRRTSQFGIGAGI